MKAQAPPTPTDNRHPSWRKDRDPAAEAQADWYETLRDTAILRGLHRDIAAAEGVWERVYRSLPSEDVRLWLHQWSEALRDETPWNPAFPPEAAYCDPLLINHQGPTHPRGRIARMARDHRAPDGDCPQCGKPVYAMHMVRHLNKWHGAAA